MNSRIYYNNQCFPQNEMYLLQENAEANGDAHNLHLAVSWNNMQEPTYALFSGLNQTSGFLGSNKIYSASFMHNIVQTHEYFAPLSNAIAEAQENNIEIKPESFILLAWYYLTDSAISVPFMEKWLISDGFTEQKAKTLTLSVYIARTDRDDSDDVCWVSIKDAFDLMIGTQEMRQIKISSKEDYFKSIDKQDSYCLVYDDFAAYEWIASDEQCYAINCRYIPETGMLVEDHHHVILGLSTLLCETITLCDFGAPTFNAFILDRVSLSETTYISLGTFLHKYADELAEFINENNLKFSLKVMDNNFIASSVFLEEGISNFTSQNPEAPLLPLFLDIEKS